MPLPVPAKRRKRKRETQSVAEEWRRLSQPTRQGRRSGVGLRACLDDKFGQFYFYLVIIVQILIN
jgi:hypothetical protein